MNIRLPLRSRTNRLFGGVCGGLSESYGIEPEFVRLAFVVLSLASGAGIALYLLLWLIMPIEAPQTSDLREMVRINAGSFVEDLRDAAARGGAVFSGPQEFSLKNRKLLGLGLFGGGGFLVLYSLGLFQWLGPVRSLGLAAMMLGASVLAARPQGDDRV